jgi:DNA-binding Lrp family transcriptional regulator
MTHGAVEEHRTQDPGGLLTNAKMTDRQLAKQIGVSQPTVTRRRAKLENSALDGYTVVLN